MLLLAGVAYWVQFHQTPMLLLAGVAYWVQFHPTRNTSQQQHRWTIPEAVVTVICS